MSEGKQYVTAVGFVQFDPAQREANGKQITEVVIKTPGGDGKNIRVTIWPELKVNETIEKGDYVAVHGEFKTNTYQAQDGGNRTSLQISAYNLFVGKGAKRAETQVVGATPASTVEVPF